jgi:histidine triad (HIT) family protein
MPLTEKQITDIKSQLISQLSSLPEEKRKTAEDKILSLSEKEIEDIIREQKNENYKKDEIFRLIIEKKIPSKIIDENEECLVVLDIRPISLGHIIIIPKEKKINPKDFGKRTFSMVKKISKIITKKLKCKNINIQTEFKFGESVINLIPIYDSPLDINSPRKEEKEEKLQQILDLIRVKKRIKKQVIKIKKNQSSALKMSRRVA